MSFVGIKHGKQTLINGWKYPHTPEAADVYTAQAGLWDTLAWCHLNSYRPLFPHSHWVRLMPHMCTACTAVLFYSKLYQHIKGRWAQQGVSWLPRAEVRRGGKSQIVGAPHMCCTSDEKLRCRNALLFYFSLFHWLLFWTGSGSSCF